MFKPLTPSIDPHHDGRCAPLHRRRVAWQLALVVVAVLAWYFAPSVRDLTTASWRRQCATYAAPPGQVVYDDDPSTYTTRLKDAAFTSTSLTLRKDAGYALRENQAWQGLAQSQGGWRVAPVAYLGARTSPGGRRRLVAVQFGALQSEGGFHQTRFSVYLETSGVTGLMERPVTNAQSTHFWLYRFPTDSVRIMDGVPDPKDPSRFTIDMQVNGVTYTIGGQLDDNDVVTLVPPPNSAAATYYNVVYWCPTGAPLPQGLVRAFPAAPVTRPADTRATGATP